MVQFINIGDRVRYVGGSKYRRGDWPEGAWLEAGIVGTVVKYNPELPALRIRGETIEGISAWAVVA